MNDARIERWEGMKLWKLVDAEHAESVQSGTLRLGTLQSFAELENGRDDKLDGGVRILLRDIYTSSDDPNFVADMSKRGIDVRSHQGPGKIFVAAVNNAHEEHIRNCWAFCTTVVGNTYDSQTDKPKAIFEISNAADLFRELDRCLPREVVRIGIAYVKYEPREFAEDSIEICDPDPLVKAMKYAPEEEVRYLLTGSPGRARNPIWVRDNPRIATLFRRLNEDEIAEAAQTYAPTVRRFADFTTPTE